ncbi:MAG: hypothetical protein RLZZ136_1855 [Pseudomonadota bacterium]
MIMKPMMKSGALAALAIALALPSLAQARPGEDWEPDGGGRRSTARMADAAPPADRPPATPSPRREAPVGGQPQAGGQARERPPVAASNNGFRAPHDRAQANDGRHGDDRPAANWRGEQHREDTWRSGYNRRGAWDRDWRRNNHNDWRGWRDNHREFYRLSRYSPPYRSWTYRRLGVGFFLDRLFFSTSYWITNPQMYRLPEAYGPYRWVRYYDDAMLVNIYSGEVEDVIYDFFW